MKEHRYFVYVLPSRSHNFYIGVTNSLRRRIFQHKNHTFEGFTARYNIDRLVYYAVYRDIGNAIAREKQLKRWSREKEIALIEGMNPTWQDLSEGWYDDIVLELESTADPSTSPSPDPQETRVEEKAGERSAQDDNSEEVLVRVRDGCETPPSRLLRVFEWHPN